MKNLQEQILGALQGTNNTDGTNSYLAKIQDNLITNYSNDKLPQEYRNNILSDYSTINNLKNAFYRYNVLKNGEMHEDAEKEKNNIVNMLQKGTANAKYAWGLATNEKFREEFKKDPFNAVVDEAAKHDNAYGDLARNYKDMKAADTHYSDKYFHAKGNCQAAQRGKEGEGIAKQVSLGREIIEGANNVLGKGYDLNTQIKDAQDDMKANEFGRKLGRENPNTDCKILVEKLRPNGLPKRY